MKETNRPWNFSLNVGGEMKSLERDMRPMEGSFKSVADIVAYLYAVGKDPIFRGKLMMRKSKWS